MKKLVTILLVAIAVVGMAKPYDAWAGNDNDVDTITIKGDQSKDELYWIRGLNSEICCEKGSLFGTANEPHYGTRIHTETVKSKDRYGATYSVPYRYEGCRFSLSANSWLFMKNFDKGSMRIFR
jgi:hypothetical protein